MFHISIDVGSSHAFDVRSVRFVSVRANRCSPKVSQKSILRDSIHLRVFPWWNDFFFSEVEVFEFSSSWKINWIPLNGRKSTDFPKYFFLFFYSTELAHQFSHAWRYYANTYKIYIHFDLILIIMHWHRLWINASNEKCNAIFHSNFNPFFHETRLFLCVHIVYRKPIVQANET